jgi:hypothetical protein
MKEISQLKCRTEVVTTAKTTTRGIGGNLSNRNSQKPVAPGSQCYPLAKNSNFMVIIIRGIPSNQVVENPALAVRK